MAMCSSGAGRFSWDRLQESDRCRLVLSWLLVSPWRFSRRSIPCDRFGGNGVREVRAATELSITGLAPLDKQRFGSSVA